MTKKKGLLISLAGILSGYLSLYLAWGILPGPAFSTLALLLGLALIIFGIVMFIVSVTKY